MTGGLGGAAPQPGYYPDPDGAPGMVRWWNGVSWSDVATPAGPGVAVRHSPVLAPPSASDPPPPVPPSNGDRTRTGWVVGLSVLALVLVVVVGLVTRSGREDDAVATDPSASVLPPPAGPTFPPGTTRIVDEAAGISYPWLGSGWFEWALGRQSEVSSIAGQFFTTQEITPGGTTFIAQCTSGPLTDRYGWAGPSTLRATVGAVADSVRRNYYPGPNEREVLRDEPRTVDGAPAHLVEFQLTWDVPGYDASGERAAVLLVDVGRPAPALLYISIPNTHAELYGVIDQVLGAVEVL